MQQTTSLTALTIPQFGFWLHIIWCFRLPFDDAINRNKWKARYLYLMRVCGVLRPVKNLSRLNAAMPVESYHHVELCYLANWPTGQRPHHHLTCLATEREIITAFLIQMRTKENNGKSLFFAHPGPALVVSASSCGCVSGRFSLNLRWYVKNEVSIGRNP